MSDTRLFEITHDRARSAIKAEVDAQPIGRWVKFMPATRSLKQNAQFHALCADAAKNLVYLGRRLTSQQWKTLFISGHSIATGLGADMIPGLESEYVNVRESSAEMGVGRMSSLIDYTSAWIENHAQVTA